jgi:hypothetical protein
VWINWSSKNKVSLDLELYFTHHLTYYYYFKVFVVDFSPCKRYTSWISFTKYCWTAAGPWILKISWSNYHQIKAHLLYKVIFLNKNLTWNLTKYFLTSPNLDSITISRLPLLIFQKTTPSISETTAGITSF